MSPEERAEFIADVAAAVQHSGHAPLTGDEQRWVRLAIQREAQSIDLRRAIIEKTLAGLAWAAIVGIGAVLLEYLRAHGLK